MKILFFGSPQFSAKILKYLIDHHVEVKAVVCQPAISDDDENNAVRNLAMTCFSMDKILQPKNAADPEFLQTIKDIGADLFVVVSYGQILKQVLLDIPPLGCINIHGSILPKYRGAAPIQRAIMNGDKKTGITIMKMTAKMDAGDIIATHEVAIDDNDNYRTLEEKLYEAAAPLLLSILNNFSFCINKAYRQEESKVTFASKITKEEFFINWQEEAHILNNKIRGLYPQARCYVKVNGKKKLLKILKAFYVDKSGPLASVLVKDKTSLIVACGGGALSLLEVQLEGKKPLLVSEFLKGVQEIEFISP